MFADFTKVGYCAICGRKVKAETMCKFCADYESRIAKLKDENVILKQEIAQLEEQCEKLIEKRDALTIHKDKELSVYVKALQLACEALSDAKDMFFSIKQDQLGHWIDDGENYYLTKAKAEVENDNRN